MIKNYVKLNEQFSYLAKNVRISANAQALFRWVFDAFNTAKWPDEVKIANSLLYKYAGFSRKQLERAREELIELNVISYVKRNGATGSVYIINDLENLNKMFNENETKQTNGFFSNTKKCDKTNTQNATKQTNEIEPLSPTPPYPYISTIENINKRVYDYDSRNTECENDNQECEIAKKVNAISKKLSVFDFEILKKAINNSRFLQFKLSNNPQSVLSLVPKIQREPTYYDDYKKTRAPVTNTLFKLTRKYSEKEVNSMFDDLNTVNLKT